MFVCFMYKNLPFSQGSITQNKKTPKTKKEKLTFLVFQSHDFVWDQKSDFSVQCKHKKMTKIACLTLENNN